jgi:hypothetical protein
MKHKPKTERSVEQLELFQPKPWRAAWAESPAASGEGGEAERQFAVGFGRRYRSPVRSPTIAITAARPVRIKIRC